MRSLQHLLNIIQNNKYNFLGIMIYHVLRFLHMTICFTVSRTDFPDHTPEVATHHEKTLPQTYSSGGAS